MCMKNDNGRYTHITYCHIYCEMRVRGTCIHCLMLDSNVIPCFIVNTGDTFLCYCHVILLLLSYDEVWTILIDATFIVFRPSIAYEKYKSFYSEI